MGVLGLDRPELIVIGSATACALALLVGCVSAAVAGPLPDGFVHLRDVAPAIHEDMRYAGPFNFTGARVPGYRAPRCILSREAAEALGRVQTRLEGRGFGLKIYDCYRPQRAVDAFRSWVGGSGAGPMAAIFHPTVPRGRLIADGYIASRSAHARGSTVDLGLVRAGEPERTTRSGGRCDGPFGERADESSVDLGTAYDCLSPKSATASRAVSAGARRRRALLADAMAAEGFAGYRREWWHFTLRDEPFPKTSFDFPVE